MTRHISVFLCLITLLGLNARLFAQNHSQPSVLKETPKWTITADKKEVKIGDEVTLTLTSVIEKDWYMYSNDFDPNLGPIAAEVKFITHKSYKTVGKTTPVGSKKHYEEVWEGTVSVFTGKAVFKQKVKILAENPQIKVTLYFQECSEITGVCMPPFDQEYEVKNLFTVTGNVQTENTTSTAAENTVDSIINENNTDTTPKMTVQKIEPGSSVASGNLEDELNKATLWGLFLLSFFAGISALATPCVYPMIPMTVSFFTKKSSTRIAGIMKGVIFGMSIIFIYTIIGVLAAVTIGPEIGNIMSTHWLPNLIFFVVFLIFGAAFLGMFELTLPSGMVNRIDKMSNMNSNAGIFFMAFTLVVVSFSCTGPIAGSVLSKAANGEFIRPIVGMFGFSLAFALPFALFAIFPSWLQNLPKSGGWLNSVKVVLGFVEIGFAFKFLSNADVVYHWRILDREIYLSIWIVLSFLLGMYLLGKLKFSHDSDLPYISVPRFGLALVAFIFGVYMIPGLFGAPLKGLSGLLPPMQTQDFILGANTGQPAATSAHSSANIKHADFLHLPHALTGYFDYKQALEESKKQNKPIFIDFTGHACVNCRKMEEYVWAKPEVLKRLQNDFIIVSLYADERKELPENEWYTSTRDGKVKKTIGEQNQDLQISKYNFSAQPQYVIIDANENKLSGPNFFDTDEQKFVDFLDKGKNAFKQN